MTVVMYFGKKNPDQIEQVHLTYNIYMLHNSMKQKYNKLYSTISFVVNKSLFRD